MVAQLALAIDEGVGAQAGDAQHVPAGLRGPSGRAGDGDQIVEVGDAAAEHFPADVLAVPVLDLADDLVGCDGSAGHA